MLIAFSRLWCRAVFGLEPKNPPVEGWIINIINNLISN